VAPVRPAAGGPVVAGRGLAADAPHDRDGFHLPDACPADRGAPPTLGHRPAGGSLAAAVRMRLGVGAGALAPARRRRMAGSPDPLRGGCRRLPPSPACPPPPVLVLPGAAACPTPSARHACPLSRNTP